MIILCTSRFNSTSSAFCPHSLLMGFRMVRTENHLFCLCTIHWLVFLIKVNCFLSEVRNKSLHSENPYTVSRSHAMAQAVSRRPLTTGPRFDPTSVRVRYEVGKLALAQGFDRVLRFSHVIIISTMLHNHLHVYVALTRSTNGRNLRTF